MARPGGVYLVRLMDSSAVSGEAAGLTPGLSQHIFPSTCFEIMGSS